jgi:hypothetical protein
MFTTAQKTAAPKAAKPKTPGPVAKKAAQMGENAARTLAPYLVALVLAVITAFVTGESWVLTLVLGAAGWHGVLRLHEGYGWHRRGGRAAARKRRQYQGPASRAEIQHRLSARAIRRRAHITRPATDAPRTLPVDELGVLIGETVRRSR